MVLNCFLNELEDLVRNLLLGIKKSLLLVILPVESEIQNADCLPEIAQLSACSVDDAGHFVCHDEFKILKQTQLVYSSNQTGQNSKI